VFVDAGNERVRIDYTSVVTPAEVLTELSIRVYEEPLSGHRDSGAIADLSQPLSVVMLLIDFDTEITMNGIVDGFIGNSTGKYARQTVKALELVGCTTLASQLGRVLDIADRAGMTHGQIQEDRSHLELHAVTTFRDTHGDRWEQACEAIYREEEQMDYQALQNALQAYVGKHIQHLEPLVRDHAK